MSKLYSHLADIVETADGGFNLTRKGRQYFSRFLRQHGKSLGTIRNHAALIDVLRECNEADFASLRERSFPGQSEGASRENGTRERLVA